MRTSFISELSVALVTAPQEYADTFLATAQYVLPLYHYAGREGGNQSLASDRGLGLRTVAVFPRRPKVADPGDDEIEVKFNAILFDWARELDILGIPAVAFTPLVSSLFDLGSPFGLGWFAT